MNQTIAYISTTSSYLKEIIDKKSLRIFAADLILSNASTELQIFYKILDSEKLSWLTHIPFIITNELGDIGFVAQRFEMQSAPNWAKFKA